MTAKEIQELYNQKYDHKRNQDLTLEEVQRKLAILSKIDDGIHMDLKNVKVRSDILRSRLGYLYMVTSYRKKWSSPTKE